MDGWEAKTCGGDLECEGRLCGEFSEKDERFLSGVWSLCTQSFYFILLLLVILHIVYKSLARKLQRPDSQSELRITYSSLSLVAEKRFDIQYPR